MARASEPPTVPFPMRGFMEFSLAEFGAYVKDTISLSQARVLSIEGYYEYASWMKHRFVLLELLVGGQHQIWLRLDRRIEAGVSPLYLVITAGRARANDRASISMDRDKLVSGASRESSRTLKKSSSLAELMGLLLIITQELDFCSIWPENCWLFCSIIQQYFVASDDGWSSSTIQSVNHINLGRSIRQRVFSKYRTNHGAKLHPDNPHSMLQIDTTRPSSIDGTPSLRQDVDRSNMYATHRESHLSAPGGSNSLEESPHGHYTKSFDQDPDTVMLLEHLNFHPHSLGNKDHTTNKEQLLERLQDLLDSPNDKLGEHRPRALRLLQNIAAESGKLPRRVKLLKVCNQELRDAGGEAIIWTAELDGSKVIVREPWPPANKKWTSPEGMQIIAAIRREIISHIQIQHANILPIIGIISSDAHPLSIVVPLAVNGDALEYLSNLDGPLRAAAVLNIIQNVAYALEYLHYMVPPIIHGDLHARNILVDAQGNALLCDFGLSRIKHEQTRSATNIVEGGRYRYMAPELLSPSAEYKFRTTPASDCYAFAMTILQLVTLEKPFAEYKYESGAFHAAERGLRPQHPPLEAFGTLSELIVDLLWTLLTYMWDHEENKRPGMDTVAYRVGELRSLDIQNYF